MAAMGMRPASREDGRRTHDQLPVQHTFQPENLIRERAQYSDGTFERQHLETQVRVEMHVHGRQDVRVVGMARLDEPVRQLALVVVVDQRQRADAVSLGIGRMVFDETAAHQIAHRL